MQNAQIPAWDRHHWSTPEMVMRTGSIAVFNPLHVRQDIDEDHVNWATRIPVGMPAGEGIYSPPAAPLAPAPAATHGYFGVTDVEMLGPDGVDLLGLGAFDTDAVKTYAFGSLAGLALGVVAGLVLGESGEKAKTAAKYGAVAAGSGVIGVAIARMK